MKLELHCDQCGKDFVVTVFAPWRGTQPDPVGVVVLEQHKKYDCEKKDDRDLR